MIYDIENDFIINDYHDLKIHHDNELQTSLRYKYTRIILEFSTYYTESIDRWLTMDKKNLYVISNDKTFDDTHKLYNVRMDNYEIDINNIITISLNMDCHTFGSYGDELVKLRRKSKIEFLLK